VEKRTETCGGSRVNRISRQLSGLSTFASSVRAAGRSGIGRGTPETLKVRTRGGPWPVLQ